MGGRAVTSQSLANDLLGHAARLDVGRVEKVDAGAEGAVNDPDRVGASFPHSPNIIAPRHSGLT